MKLIGEPLTPGLRSRRKNVAAPAPALFFSWTLRRHPAPALLVVVSVALAPKPSFFLAWLRLLCVFTH